MPDFKVVYEEFKIRGEELVDQIKALIHEGNIRRIIVKDEKGNTFMEIPLTLAAVGVIAAPVLAAVATLTALISNFTLGVERVKTTEGPVSEEPASQEVPDPPVDPN
jgi:hypothetical protein